MASKNLLSPASYVAGEWLAPSSSAQLIASAVTGEPLAQAGGQTISTDSLLSYGKQTGGPALRRLSFHDRAKLLKSLALHLQKHREHLYELSYHSGATLADSKIDIDGGIGTLLVFASKARREMPDDTVYIDGDLEQLSRKGSFVGQHISASRQGVAVHINAFNFPVWGMLEKFAPTFLAGMPSIIKPATATSYITEACFRYMIESNLLPPGSLQLIVGQTGDLIDQLSAQDVVSFTGSAKTALMLRSNANLLENSVRFIAEQDSLNATVLGLDAAPDTPEFKLFIKEVVNEMTVKAGQKCTAIRRIFAPEMYLEAVKTALVEHLKQIKIGHPAHSSTNMGCLVSLAQRDNVLSTIASLEQECDRVYGDTESFSLDDIDVTKGAYLPPVLLQCLTPNTAKVVHTEEAFGPVSTLMPYTDIDNAIELLNRGGGSLVASVFTHNSETARQMVLGAAAFHGRLYFNNRDSADEATSHGSPLPHMVHGGPGRAGGGEELGGVRGVLHYMQRTAVQGSPDIISAVRKQWVPGATESTGPEHPFRRSFHDLQLGETIVTEPRVITLDDIEHFAHFTGDTFYAHMDEEAASANPFFPGRVAHGYLLLSFAAGLFVEPSPGPVLANTGLNELAFQKPVSPGDAIQVRLTVKRKTPRTSDYGEVRWHVNLSNQDHDTVATYELLTMVSYKHPNA